MQIDELQKLCAEWQEKLRLQDWKIDLRLVRHYDLQPNTAGCIDPLLESKEAVIKVMVDADRFPSCLQTTEEETLIHELLHLHFEPFWSDGKRVEMETAIHILAQSLYKLKYKTPIEAESEQL